MKIRNISGEEKAIPNLGIGAWGIDEVREIPDAAAAGLISQTPNWRAESAAKTPKEK